MIVPVSAGVTVESFTFPFLGALDPGIGRAARPPRRTASIDLGDVGTVVGIVAVINVINLIDGVDGLAAGVCLISGVTLAVIALSLDRNAAGVLAALTAGASLGFLRHGFPPATTFMGDTGSNLLGYLLGVVAVQGALKTNAVIALFLPLIILAVPILDTGFVVAKRLKYRRPDLPGGPLALPPPDGRHRLLAAAHARLPLRLDGGDGGAGAGPALRPLQRRPRELRLLLERGHGVLRPARARGQRLSGRGPRDPQAAPGTAAPAGRPAPRRGEARPGGRRPSTARSNASSRPGASRRSIPRRASSRPSTPTRHPGPGGSGNLTKWL